MATLTSPSLGKLLTNIRNMLSQPDPANSTWSDYELTEYINEAIRMYFAEVVKHSEGYFTTSTTLDITANTETVALPADFYEVRALYILRTNGYEILPYNNNLTDGFYTNSGTSGNTYAPYYFFRGNNIVLRPTPNFSQTAALRMEYLQFPDTVVNGGDTMTNQVSPIFKQLIEMYSVYKAKLKESLGGNGLQLEAPALANLNQIYTQFKDAINKRSQYPEFTVPFHPEGDY